MTIIVVFTICYVHIACLVCSKQNYYFEVNIILIYRFYIKATRFSRAMLSTVIPNSEWICSILLNTNVNELCCILCYIFFYIHRDYFFVLLKIENVCGIWLRIKTNCSCSCSGKLVLGTEGFWNLFECVDLLVEFVWWLQHVGVVL